MEDRKKIETIFTFSLFLNNKHQIGAKTYFLKPNVFSIFPMVKKIFRNTILFQSKINGVHVPLLKIVEILKAKTHGWIHYYGKFRLSEMHKVFRILNMRLARMVRGKYRRLRNRHWYYSYNFLKTISKDYPMMFVHWEHGFHP